VAESCDTAHPTGKYFEQPHSVKAKVSSVRPISNSDSRAACTAVSPGRVTTARAKESGSNKHAIALWMSQKSPFQFAGFGRADERHLSNLVPSTNVET
jgi:hypothetical protein